MLRTRFFVVAHYKLLQSFHIETSLGIFADQKIVVSRGGIAIRWRQKILDGLAVQLQEGQGDGDLVAGAVHALVLHVMEDLRHCTRNDAGVLVADKLQNAHGVGL